MDASDKLVTLRSNDRENRVSSIIMVLGSTWQFESRSKSWPRFWQGV